MLIAILAYWQQGYLGHIAPFLLYAPSFQPFFYPTPQYVVPKEMPRDHVLKDRRIPFLSMV